MIQFLDDPARPLKASSQRPSSQARFSTKFIVLGLLGLGLLTSTVKGAPQIGTLHLSTSFNILKSSHDSLLSIVNVGVTILFC